jgi:hypothetical protein
MAAPILRAPSERTVGIEFAGRYSDPFIVMYQYGAGLVPAPFLQPATDLPGIVLARRVGGVAAYNIVDLISFPLAALAAYLLALTLTGSRVASAAAALMFAWSPFHVAHAAYHIHIAQTQWLPLTLLAVWLVAARPTAGRLAFAAVSGIVMCAASFYWAFIGAVVVPVAIVAASIVVPLDMGRSRSRAVLTSATLAAVMAVVGVVAVAVLPILVSGDPLRYAFTPADQALYAARWSSYLLPPIDHPLLAGVRVAIAGAASPEQQVGPGWSVLVLAAIGVVMALREGGTIRSAVAWLLVLAGIAAVCSTDPIARALFAAAPLLRSHARFGGVVALCAAICAGIGLAGLWRRARWAAVLLAALAMLELRPYAVRARDVLPTPGYRWLAAQRDWKVLDCTTPGREYPMSVAVVVGAHAGFRQPPFDDCAAPDIAGTLARFGYTHLLIRNGSREGRWLSRGGRLSGLTPAAASIDDRVFVVDAPAASVYVSRTMGFHEREFDGAATWRWMPREAGWSVVNTGPAAAASLDVRAAAFEGARDLEIWIGGARAAVTRIDAPAWYRLGPIQLRPGETPLLLRVPQGDVEADAALHNRDARRLAIRFDEWRWTVAAR